MMQYRSTAVALVVLVTLAAESQTLGQSTSKNKLQSRRFQRLEAAHKAASEVADLQKRGKAMVQVATQFAKSGHRARALQIAKAIRDGNSKHVALAAVEKVGLIALLSKSEKPTIDDVLGYHLFLRRLRTGCRATSSAPQPGKR